MGTAGRGQQPRAGTTAMGGHGGGGNGSHGQEQALTLHGSSSELKLRIRDSLRARREGQTDRHRDREGRTPTGEKDRGPAKSGLSEDDHSRGAQRHWSSGKRRLLPTPTVDKMTTAWSRGAVGQPLLPQGDGATGLWNSSSEAPHPASGPGDAPGEDRLTARARAPLSTGQVRPGSQGTPAHLAPKSTAAEHGVPPACSPCAVLVFGLRRRCNFSNFFR